MHSGSRIKVYVRAKPINKSEISSVTTNGKTILLKKSGEVKEFKNCFTDVFGPTSSQEDLYEKIGTEVIANVLEGYNTCIFAYGQTGCFAKNTPIMSHTGTFIPVQDIKIGDFIMGDDKTRRTVLKLFRGVQEMYEIYSHDRIPKITVNAEHILVLWKDGKYTEMTAKQYAEAPRKVRNRYFSRLYDENPNMPHRLLCECEDPDLNNCICRTCGNSHDFGKSFSPLIRPVGVGEYYGFMLDGNHRFLGEDGYILRNSGKTHTITGTAEQPGLIPRICREIFDQKNDNLHVELSYMELYCDEIHDLLNKTNVTSSNRLVVRQHNIYGIYVEGLKKVAVRDYGEIEEYIKIANKNRATASTNMNERSSRSHAIMTLHLSNIRTEAKEVINKLHVVDLAGSEDSNMSGVNGVKLKEMIKINLSLTYLNRVLKLLVQSQGVKKPQHIPYLNTKLTHILKESLGGNSKTYMIATIASNSLYEAETARTLEYANVAAMIVNKAVIQEHDPQNAIQALQKEIEILRKRLSEDAPSSANRSELEAELRSMELLYADKEKSWESKLAESEMLNKQKDDQLRQRDEEIIAYTTALERQADEKKELIKQINALKSGAQTVRSTVTMDDVKRLEQLIKSSSDTTKFERKIQEHQQIIQEDQQTIQELKKTNQDLRDELQKKDAALQQEANKFAQDRSMLNRQIEKLKLRISKLESTNNDVEDLNEKYNELKRKYDEDEQKHNSLINEIQARTQRMQELDEENKHLEEQNANAYEQYTAINKSLVQAKEEYDSLLSRRSLIQANFDIIREKIKSFSDSTNLDSEFSAISELMKPK